MTRLRWRWEEKDFGFRFQSGSGRKKGEYYQAASAGEFYIVPAKHQGVGALRVAIMNPLTTAEHLDQLMDALRRHGRELLQERA